MPTGKPFTSQKQRGLFFAAKSNPAVRARTGISQSVANRMTSEDTGGKLPMRAPKTPRMARGGHIPGAMGGPTREELDPGVREAAGLIDTERLRGYARGGPPHVGEPVLVGERGPELFVADRPGTVIPNHEAFGSNPRFLRGQPRGLEHGGHLQGMEGSEIPGYARGGHVEPFAGEETAAEERAEGHVGHRFHGGVHVHHHMARGGRIEEHGHEMTHHPAHPSRAGRHEGSGARRPPDSYGSPEEFQSRHLLAGGAAGGDLRMAPNAMSSLPDAADQTAMPGGRPEPQGRPGMSGPGKSKGGGKLATFGALHGLRRGPSPHTKPRGNPPAHDRPNTKAIPHNANPRGNPVGVGRAESPRSPSAKRQI